MFQARFPGYNGKMGKAAAFRELIFRWGIHDSALPKPSASSHFLILASLHRG